jgi:acyl dehydratase
VHPGDELTAEVEVLEARDDKPVWRLRTTITSDRDGAAVLDGTAVVWRDPVVAAATAPPPTPSSGVAGPD